MKLHELGRAAMSAHLSGMAGFIQVMLRSPAMKDITTQDRGEIEHAVAEFKDRSLELLRRWEREAR